MDLNAKAAYIKGLMDGMNFDVNTNEGKLLAAMQGLLEDLAEQVTEHDNELSQVYDELDAIDEDMDDLESIVYDVDDEEDDDEEDDGEDAEYELTCPKCGAVTVVDEEALMSEEIHCQNCGAAFDIEFGVCNPEDAPCETAEDEE